MTNQQAITALKMVEAYGIADEAKKKAITALERIDIIEKIAREAFQNPDTKDINLYRSQKLADIFAIFEYDGATIPEKKEETVEDDDQMTFDDLIGKEAK